MLSAGEMGRGKGKKGRERLYPELLKTWTNVSPDVGNGYRPLYSESFHELSYQALWGQSSQLPPLTKEEGGKGLRQ